MYGVRVLCVVYVGSGYKKIVAKKTATANILKEMKEAGLNISPMSKTSKKV